MFEQKNYTEKYLNLVQFCVETLHDFRSYAGLALIFFLLCTLPLFWYWKIIFLFRPENARDDPGQPESGIQAGLYAWKILKPAVLPRSKTIFGNFVDVNIVLFAEFIFLFTFDHLELNLVHFLFFVIAQVFYFLQPMTSMII
jgi:hypothetical protein